VKFKSGTLSGIETILAPTRHIFLSPHYDDIALSCGGTAALLTREGRQPEVALIFGSPPDPTTPLTSFAEAMHEGWGLDSAQVIAGRRSEEAFASVILGTTDSFLPFRDAIYRGERYLSNDGIFGDVAADEADLPRAIIEALRLEADERSTTRLYAPLAIGNHVDHQIAFRAGVAMAREGWTVWFYEDLPYALLNDARDVRIAAAAEGLVPAGVVDVGSAWEQKIAAIMAYPSQLATVFAYVDAGSTREEIDAVMTGYAQANGNGTLAERFWEIGERDQK
jgi:LmbE family N-acetylglucosaminyl deacetylase